MDSDKIERAIEFLLKQQADYAARMADAATRMDKTDIQIKETGKQIRELTASTIRFQQEMKRHLNILTPLLEVQSRRLDRLEGLS